MLYEGNFNLNIFNSPMHVYYVTFRLLFKFKSIINWNLISKLRDRSRRSDPSCL